MKDTYVQHCGDDPNEIGGLLHTMPFREGSRVISHVWTNDTKINGVDHRGHGHADQLLDQVSQDADKSGTRLHLQVGDGDPDVDLDRLSGLYKRHGFDWDDSLGGEDEGAMTREPRRIESLGAAATKPKARAPEEVWYDVHKHPEGVPGGMGKSPEHHLRGRGWSGHEINEGSGKKTIQYRNHKHPDFVISYGGGTSTKPDHNFRVLYMGTNTNVPKVTRSYSVAEAMNKVEELHQLHNGLVVQPMTHVAAGPLGYEHAVEGSNGLSCPNCGSGNLYSRGFRVRQEEPDLGCNDCREKMHSPEDYPVVSDDGWERGDDAFGMTHGAAVAPTPPSQQKQPLAPGAKPPAKPRDMTDADSYPQFPAQPEHERTWWNPEHDQLKEIPDPPPIKPPKYAAGPPRIQNDHGTLAGRNRHKTSGTEVCPLCNKAKQIYRRDPGLYRDLLQDSGGLTEDHLHTTSPFHDRVNQALTPQARYQPPRHPEGQGPADLGRSEYQRQWRAQQQAHAISDTVQTAGWYGMELDPDDVARYPRLKKVVSVLRQAQQSTWEEDV